MSTGKIELSVGDVKIADKYEILTEEEIHNIDNKIPELEGRVIVIEDELEQSVKFEVVGEGSTVQLYSDREKKNKGYPITSPDRVIDENGVNIKEQLDNINNEINNKINNKIPELDERVGNIEDEIEEINSSLDNTGTNSEFGFNYKKQYVIIDNNIVRIQFLYSNNETMWIELSKCGVNNTFSFSKIYTSPLTPNTIELDGDFSKAVLQINYGTDLLSPLQVEAVNNVDGDLPPNPKFTGGWHGYNGDQTGTPTARQGNLYIYVDGKNIGSNAKFEGMCEEVFIINEHIIQAWNTRKQDGSGREVVNQTFNMSFKQGMCEIYTDIRPIETVKLSLYYGFQSSFNNLHSSPTIHYVNGDGLSRKGVNSNSGPKSYFSDVDRYVVTGENNDSYMAWIDRSYGLGTLSYITDDTNISFSSESKCYFNIVNGKTVVLSSGQRAELHGGIIYCKSETTSGCDLMTKILINGKIYKLIDFIRPGSCFMPSKNVDYFKECKANLKDFKKDDTVTGLETDYIYTKKFTSTGYGSYIFNFE